MATKQTPTVKDYYKNDTGQFVCNFCGDVKNKQNTMHYHVNKNHKGTFPHKCNGCKKEFLQKSALDIHIAARHPESLEKVIPKYKCPCCKYNSINKGNRRIHYFRLHLQDIVSEYEQVIIEDDIKQFKCLCCEKILKSQTSFLYHLGECVCLSDFDPRKSDWELIMEFGSGSEGEGEGEGESK